MNFIKDLFKKLNPRQKKLAIVTLIVGCFITLLVLGYRFRGGSEAAKPVAEEKKKVNLDPNLLEKAYSENIRKELDKRNNDLNELKIKVEEMMKMIEEDKKLGPDKTPPPTGKTDFYGRPNETSKTIQNFKARESDTMPLPPRPSFPQPPGPSGFPSNQALPGQGPAKDEVKAITVGSIDVVSSAQARKDDKPPDKARRKVYLPPSFMETTLLTGFSAATMQSAKTYEKPLLLRVKDIAVLPNDVKANLKGCFIIASAYGDLSDERAHARLVNLSCISKTGESVIDAPVKGFLVDSDGKIGLAGEVVTRMGALLGRSIIAGFFGGIGDALKASTTTQAISALGATQTVDPGKVLQSGVGGGLSSGFSKLQDFYLEMAKQTFPIIEVGAVKTVTAVIETGVELEIKDYCIGGFEKCEKRDF